MGDIGDILTDTYTFDDLFPDRSRQSTKRGRATHQRGGVVASDNVVIPAVTGVELFIV